MNKQFQNFLFKVSLFVIAYLALVRINLAYLMGTGAVSVFWLPSGLAIAAGLIGGKRYLWGVFVGAFIAYSFDHSIAVALGLALAALLEGYCGTWLVTRVGKLDRNLGNHADILKLVSLAGFVATTIGALVGTATLLLSGILTEQTYLSALCRWWMGDALGIILLTPFILTWQRPPENWQQSKRFVEIVLVLSIAFLVGQVVFMGWLHDSLGYFPKGYLMFMFITLVALRLGTHGALTVMLIAAVQGLLGAIHGVGYFANDIADSLLVNFWFYMVVLSFVGIALAIFISAEKRDKEALRDQERFFRLITENIDDFIAVLDLDGKRLYNSPSYAKLFGDPKNLLRTDSFAEVHPEDRDRVKQVFRETVQTGIGQRIEYRFILPDGSIRFMESRGGVIRNVEGELLCIAVVSHDITERKKTDEKIYTLAYYDPLTQLPNRLMLKDRFNLAMAANKRNRRYGALMVIDLDNFKPINDNYGHDAGDVLLKEAARRIAGSVREVDTVARFGGDEFVVILSALEEDQALSKEHAARIAEKIRFKVAEPYFIETKAEDGSRKVIEHHCTASIGVTTFFSNEVSQDDIFKCADMAMYTAKESGRDQIKFYEQS